MSYFQKENNRMLCMNKGRIIYYGATYESYPMNHDESSKYWVIKLHIGKYSDRAILLRKKITNLEMEVAGALEHLFHAYECLKGLPSFIMPWLSDKDYFDINGRTKPERRVYDLQALR
jgi:hypothetical protein